MNPENCSVPSNYLLILQVQRKERALAKILATHYLQQAGEPLTTNISTLSDVNLFSGSVTRT